MSIIAPLGVILQRFTNRAAARNIAAKPSCDIKNTAPPNHVAADIVDKTKQVPQWAASIGHGDSE